MPVPDASAISPDGSSAKIQVNQATWTALFYFDANNTFQEQDTYNGCIVGANAWTDPANRTFIGTSIADEPASLTVITNADQGAAVFAPLTRCGGQSYVNNPQTQMTLVASDAVGTQAQIPGGFVPGLQREDGSYVGLSPVQVSGTNVFAPTAVDLGGNVLWQNTNVPAGGNAPSIVPEYATADGGAIFSSAPLKTCTVFTGGCEPLSSSGTQYVFDQSGNPAVDANGNPISPTPDTGTSYSWKGAYLASGTEVVNSSSPLPALGQSHEATSDGNQTHNQVAMLQHSFGLFWCGTGYGEQGRPSQCIDDVSFGLTTVTNGTGTYVTRPTDSNIGQLQNFASSQPGWVGIIENSALAAYRKAFAEYPISVVLSSEHTNGSSHVFDQEFTTFVVGTWPTPEVGFDFPGSTGRLYFFAFMDGAQQALGHNLARGEQCPGLWCDLVLPYPVTSQTAGQFRAFMQAIGTAIGNAAAHETGHYLSKLSPGGSTGLPYMDCGAGAGNAVTQVVPCENNNNFVYNFFNGNGLPQDPNDPTSNGGQFFYLNVPGEPAIHWETSDKCWLKRYAAPESSCP